MVYDIDTKKLKVSYISGIVSLVIGIVIFIIISSYSIPTFIKKNNLSEEVQATKIEWKTKEIEPISLEFYSADYTYQVNNNTYVCSSKYYGDTQQTKMTLYYDKNNPSECLTSFDIEISTIILFILVIPIVFLFAGSTTIISRRKKNKAIDHLVTYGTLIKRVPYQIYTTNKKVDGQVIKYFIVKYTFENGVKKLFKSDFFINPDCDNYGLCDLLVDEKNLDNFYIDFEIKTTGKGEPKIILYEQIYNDYDKVNY